MADALNRMTDSPKIEWIREGNENIAQIGNYHISQCYGGYCLHQMVNKHGGVNDVFNCGHIPARDLYNRIKAYMDGLQAK